MKKIILLPVLTLFTTLLLTTPATAEMIYRSTNKIDYIKTDSAPGSVKKRGPLLHPKTFESDQMRAMLASIIFDKKNLLFKDVKDKRLFPDKAVEFLTPYIIEAFQKASDKQVVVISYFTRDTKYVILNDRLTVIRAFVMEDGLHFEFLKTYAKMVGDRDTQGMARTVNQAQSIHVAVDAAPGQYLVNLDPDELVFDPNYDFVRGAETAAAASAAIPVTGKALKKTPETEEPLTPAQAEQAASSKAKDVRARLKELEQLRKDDLISEKEYQRKRTDLLDEL